MYLIFDTETTGFIRGARSSMNDHEKWPRVVQIAWIEYDEEGNKTKSFDYIIKPDGFHIPQEAIDIHRITNERAQEEGVDLKIALDAFEGALARNKYIVAHNISFDERVMAYEFFRAKRKNPVDEKLKIDTMHVSKDFAQLKGRGGRLKPPKLVELHEVLFGDKFDNAHDALADVQATGRCFFELKKRGVIGFDSNGGELQTFSTNNFEFSEKREDDPIVCLGVHTFHSILRGAGNADDYIKVAKEKGHSVIGIADRGSMSGTFEFFRKCKEEDIKPVLGMEILVNDNIGDFEEPIEEGSSYVQKVLFKNERGYKNLNKLLYMAHTEGFNGRESRVKTDWLIEHKEGLILIVSGHESMISDLLTKGMLEKAEDYFKKLKDAFGEDFYGEIRLNERADQKRFNQFILTHATKQGVDIIIDNDVHYAKKEDAVLQDTVMAIGQKVPMEKARLFDRQNLFYPSRRDYYELNKSLKFYYPEKALEVFMDNTLEVAEKCSFEFEVGVEKYPKFEAPNDIKEYFKTDDVKDIIYKLAQGKLKKKLKEKAERGFIQLTKELVDKYFSRLKYELDVIRDKKMLDYFLVNWELIRDYRSKGYEVGPARGCFLPDSLVKMSDGMSAPIESIEVDDEVFDAFGEIRKVEDVLMYNIDEEMLELEFEDGRKIFCTKDHEILTINRGWVAASELNEEDDIVDINNPDYRPT